MISAEFSFSVFVAGFTVVVVVLLGGCFEDGGFVVVDVDVGVGFWVFEMDWEGWGDYEGVRSGRGAEVESGSSESAIVKQKAMPGSTS